jgi:hypothetical protein
LNRVNSLAALLPLASDGESTVKLVSALSALARPILDAGKGDVHSLVEFLRSLVSSVPSSSDDQEATYRLEGALVDLTHVIGYSIECQATDAKVLVDEAGEDDKSSAKAVIEQIGASKRSFGTFIKELVVSRPLN